MNLIKKTVILTDADAEGYVSVIRVGNDVGAKIVGAGFKNGMHAGVRVGRGSPIFAVLTGEKTEITLDNVSFQQNDGIGCIVADGERLVAKGGSGLKLSDVTEHFAAREETLITEPLMSAESAEEEPIADEEKKSFLERLSAVSYGDFYNGIREQLDELFEIHPAERRLNDLIPDSDWIKINYEGEDYYVVGKLKENNRTVLIGYGVPGKRTATPPKIADEIASYLSVEGIEPYDGYWLIFQDSNTGKIIPAR